MRLYTIAKSVCKQLMQIYDKTIVHYQLQKRLQSNRCRLKTKQAVPKEEEKIVEEAGANHWIDTNVVEKIEITHKQEKRGRLGYNTRYVAIEHTRFQVNWEIDNTNVKADAYSDGMFLLSTNCEDISYKEILEKSSINQSLRSVMRSLKQYMV
jgi:negative regulator of sigma E activity